MIWRLILEQRLNIGDADKLYFEDILDLNEALDVWLDMNDLDKTATAESTASDGFVKVDRDSTIGRLFAK